MSISSSGSAFPARYHDVTSNQEQSLSQGPGGMSWMDPSLPSGSTSYPRYPISRSNGSENGVFMPENQIAILPGQSAVFGSAEANDQNAFAGGGSGVGTASAENEERLDGEAGKMGGAFAELIWPGWPPRLPTPSEHSSRLDLLLTD